MVERPRLRDTLRPFGVGAVIAQRLGGRAMGAGTARLRYLESIREEHRLIEEMSRQRASLQDNPDLLRAYAHQLFAVISTKDPVSDVQQHIIGVGMVCMENGGASPRQAAAITYELCDEVGAELHDIPPGGARPFRTMES